MDLHIDTKTAEAELDEQLDNKKEELSRVLECIQYKDLLEDEQEELKSLASECFNIKEDDDGYLKIPNAPYFTAAEFLEKQDPTAYAVGFGDWLYSQAEDNPDILEEYGISEVGDVVWTEASEYKNSNGCTLKESYDEMITEVSHVSEGPGNSLCIGNSSYSFSDVAKQFYDEDDWDSVMDDLDFANASESKEYIENNNVTSLEYKGKFLEPKQKEIYSLLSDIHEIAFDLHALNPDHEDASEIILNMGEDYNVMQEERLSNSVDTDKPTTRRPTL